MTSAIRIDAQPLLEAANALGRVTGEALNREFVSAVNDTLDQFDTKARRRMNAGIALTDEYVSSRMEFDPATATPEASISAYGPGRPGRKGLTILGHYSPRVVTAAAARAKGDPKRGIPAGQKAAGVSVEVTRGSPKVIAGAFTMPLLRGRVSGDQVGVFIREGGRLKHLYGVSPYSLFRFQRDQGEAELVTALEQAAAAAIDRVVQQ